MDSQIDKDGKVNKSKNDAQFTKLNPANRGGEIGTKGASAEAMPKSKEKKMFAGR